jgi:DNA primase
MQQIVEQCRFLLQNCPQAEVCRNYLDSRLSKKSQELFQFGYFPNAREASILTDVVGEEVLKKAGLFGETFIETASTKRHCWSFFENHPLIMPFKNPYGESVALIGRTLLPEAEYKEKQIVKYKNTSKSRIFIKGNNVFGLYEAKKAIIDAGAVYIVEGQFDVIKARELGINNIVALGNNNMTPYQYSVIARYATNLFLLLDNDEAGQKGRKNIAKRFGHLANIEQLYLPDEYKDIDEYITKNGMSSDVLDNLVKRTYR